MFGVPVVTLVVGLEIGVFLVIQESIKILRTIRLHLVKLARWVLMRVLQRQNVNNVLQVNIITHRQIVLTALVSVKLARWVTSHLVLAKHNVQRVIMDFFKRNRAKPLVNHVAWANTQIVGQAPAQHVPLDVTTTKT